MTVVLVDITFRHPRDQFFLQPGFLETLLDHVDACVAGLPVDARTLYFTNRSKLVHESGARSDWLLTDMDDDRDPGLDWRDIIRDLLEVAKVEDGDVLYVNPLHGPISTKRLAQTIEAGQSDRVAASAIPLAVNEHPLWVGLVHARLAARSSIILKQGEVKDSLRQNKDFLREIQNGHDSTILGSHELAQVFKCDGAVIHLPAHVVRGGLVFEELAWVPWERKDETGLPWFYSIPIWTMSRNTAIPSYRGTP